MVEPQVHKKRKASIQTHECICWLKCIRLELWKMSIESSSSHCTRLKTIIKVGISKIFASMKRKDSKELLGCFPFILS